MCSGTSTRTHTECGVIGWEMAWFEWSSRCLAVSTITAQKVDSGAKSYAYQATCGHVGGGEWTQSRADIM